MTSKKTSAFTLVELIIVIAILGIMGVSAVVGFGGLGETMAVQQVGGVIKDVIAQLESEILVEKYEKTTLYFYPRYLIAVSEPKGSEPIMEWWSDADNLCQSQGHYLLSYEDGNLTLKNEHGEILEIKAMAANGNECMDFESSGDLEWEVQLRNSEAHSPVIRFIHFTLDPGQQGKMGLKTEGVRLELEAPYASRKLYQNDILVSEAIPIVVKSAEVTSEVVIEP